MWLFFVRVAKSSITRKTLAAAILVIATWLDEDD
jgi:hypothetical protein